jgi:transposase-like protein
LVRFKRILCLVILLAVGWYLRFSLSYRDVEELLAGRGLRADPVIVWRPTERFRQSEPSGAAGNQHRQARRLSASRRAA